MGILPAWFKCTPCMQYLKRPEEVIRFPDAGVTVVRYHAGAGDWTGSSGGWRVGSAVVAHHTGRTQVQFPELTRFTAVCDAHTYIQAKYTLKKNKIKWTGSSDRVAVLLTRAISSAPDRTVLKRTTFLGNGNHFMWECKEDSPIKLW